MRLVRTVRRANGPAERWGGIAGASPLAQGLCRGGPGKRPLDWLWEGNAALSLGRRPLLVHTRWPGPRGAPESPAEPCELSVSASKLICRRDGHGWASPRAEGGPRAGVWHNSLERQLPRKRGAPRRHLPGLSPRGPEVTGFPDGGRQKEPGRAAHGAVCGLSRSPPSRQNSPIPVSQGRWEHSVRRCVQSLARKQSHCHEPDWGPSSRGPQGTAGPAPGHTVPWCLRDSQRTPKPSHWPGCPSCHRGGDLCSSLGAAGDSWGRAEAFPARLAGPESQGAPLRGGEGKLVPPPGPADVPGATQSPSPWRRPRGAAPGPPRRPCLSCAAQRPVPPRV
ncbi:synapsin-1-like [Orcinus orca]|uniref:synapsin-1-like n=1 Tax=Orcinus orca TaxID=9733 RepID=UPI0021111578|nr:synapsin-1-like [Orcinus orca]